MQELEIRLSTFANQMPGFDAKDVDYISTTYSGNHGKGKLCFVSKLVLQMKDGKQQKSIYTLAYVNCKKDTWDIFKGTVQSDLSEGINQVEQGKIKFNIDVTTGKYKCVLFDPDNEEFSLDTR